MKTALKLAAIAIFLISCGDNKKKETNNVDAEIQQERIVSLNGSITEILYALDQKDAIVGVDVTSTYPENIKETAVDLGHVNKISVESVMELKPTLILATEKEIKDDLRKQLEDTGITLKIFPHEPSIEGAKETIKKVAESLNIKNDEALIQKIDQDIANIKILDPKPKVLFIYARGAGMLMVSGTGTPIDKIISLAGGQNVITEFSDYKPLTPESLLTNNPDYILLFTTGLESVGGIDGVLKIDGIQQTNAGKNKKIIAMDGQLLSGFSPRVGEAIKELNDLLSK